MSHLSEIVDHLRTFRVRRSRSQRMRMAYRDHADVGQLRRKDESGLVLLELENRHFVIVNSEAARQLSCDFCGVF